VAVMESLDLLLKELTREKVKASGRVLFSCYCNDCVSWFFENRFGMPMKVFDYEHNTAAFNQMSREIEDPDG
jgi:hypothetical protein